MPKFTYVKLDKKLSFICERWISKCIKQVISKPSNNVVLCYLTLDAFHVRCFSEINIISTKLLFWLIFVINNGF